MEYEPTHLDLFSGIGGFAIAAQWAGFRTIGFCEIDKYCRKVFAKNFSDARNARSPCAGSGSQSQSAQQQFGNGHPEIAANIFDLDGTQFRGVDLITGGFPCQPFSVAGKRRGAADDRAIWPEMFRVINEARPAWVLGENVPGIIPMELDNVLSDLESIGYATRPFAIPACAVDARHRRDRLWVVGRNMGNASITGLEGHGNAQVTDSQGWKNESGHTGAAGRGGAVADAGCLPERRASGCTETNGWRSHSELAGGCRWLPEPDVGGSFDGLPAGLDQTGLSHEAKTRATEILCDVRSQTFTEAFQWTIGRFYGVLESEVLLAFLCKYESSRDEVRLALEERTTAIRFMRNLWREIESARSPHRRRYNQQFAQQYSDALRELPCETSSLFPQAWKDDCWEDGTLRVAHGIPSRVDRLKGLGNAIVPQVAYEILREIRKLI